MELVIARSHYDFIVAQDAILGGLNQRRDCLELLMALKTNMIFILDHKEFEL